MIRPVPEAVQIIKQRRDTALRALVEGVPYIGFLGIEVERHGDELTAVLAYSDHLIGNPVLPAIHGGVTASFLEVTAIVEISWAMLWDDLESGRLDFTVDFLRTGLPRDAYARAQVTRAGRRYATVSVEAWQDNRDRPIATANCHFLMPGREAVLDNG
jgi:uncharacterized protein (TIGR00369 family)